MNVNNKLCLLLSIIYFACSGNKKSQKASAGTYNWRSDPLEFNIWYAYAVPASEYRIVCSFGNLRGM